MTADDILALLTDVEDSGTFTATRGTVPLPAFGGVALPVLFDATNIGNNAIAEAAAALSSRPAETRAAIADALYAYCQRSFEECDGDFETPQHQLDWEAEQTGQFQDPKVPAGPADIWALVRFETLYVYRDTFADKTVAAVNGLCAWDGEHRVSVRFDNGATLIKACGIDDF